MLQKLYVNNFRCLENFDLSVRDFASVLLIGKNGSGKSTVRHVLGMFRDIGRGSNRVKDLVKLKDFGWARSSVPMRFELEVLLGGQLYRYVLALELPDNFKEARILEEQLHVSGTAVYTREHAQVVLSSSPRSSESKFSVDWHLVALPLIQEYSEVDPLHIFKTWLARMLILAPNPSQITGESKGETLKPDSYGENFGEWLTGLLLRYPSAYTSIDKYLNEVLPDFEEVRNEIIGKNYRSLTVSFKSNQAEMQVDFNDLSDGEKCFFICAVVLAANKCYGPLFCFWDEPDNYLALDEVGHFVMELRRIFKSGGQLFVTSHNPEAIRKFSDENTLVLKRSGHLEPTRLKWLAEFVEAGDVSGEIIEALMIGDIL